MHADCCCCYFASWQRRLESEPGLWQVRHLDSDLLWRNAAFRALLGLPVSLEPWPSALRYVHLDDATQVEDSHSRALKTGRLQTLTVRVKIAPHRLSLFLVIHQAAHCPRCAHCAVIISHVVPLDP